MAFLLHQLVSDSAALYPNKVAIVYNEHLLKYNELERETNKLAHALVGLNIKKGDRVGLFFDRGIESIIAACGVLKAGAVYVPIDTKSPTRRIDYIIKKCEIKSLLTVKSKLQNLENDILTDCSLERIILLDGDSSDSNRLVQTTQIINGYTVANEQGENAPNINIIDRDLAYILFTSGSTGDPKGVALSHLNSLTFINSACDFFGVNNEDRLSNIAPLYFDMSVFDIFVTFKAGACVVIIPEVTAIFPAKLAEYISEKRITVWNSVPSALSLLATNQNLKKNDFSSLRLILFAGELFPLKYLQILQEAIPGARFCNMYGQTEANSSTYYWVDQAYPVERKSLPIGKALPNFEVFALNDNGNLVQNHGQEGELYVRASTVASGYWGEPGKTENAFVSNPLQPDLSEKVYKTGDLVGMDEDGNFEFLGRRDHMIKSRGYRIEIGEIEAVLCSHPQVKTGVVIPIPDELIGYRLSAIVVPFKLGQISKDEIYKYCRSQLPHYMVPEKIEIYNALPMTSSGKVDRQKLKG